MPRSSKLQAVALFVMGLWAFALVFVLASWSFTTNRLHAARALGVFASPAEGMSTLARVGYAGIQEVRIMDVVQETALGGGSHVWFVTVCVWADARAEGSPVGSETHDFDFGGSYFVDTLDGWVMLPETSMPLFVGFWMPIFHLAGDDVAQPYHDPSGALREPCVHTVSPAQEGSSVP